MGQAQRIQLGSLFCSVTCSISRGPLCVIPQMVSHSLETMDIDHGDQGLAEPSIRSRLDALGGRFGLAGNDDPATLLLPAPGPYENIDPRPDSNSGFVETVDENDPREFPTPEQIRQNQGIDESEMETEDEQSIQEEQNLGNDETMLHSGINASLLDQVNDLAAALEKAKNGMFNLVTERDGYAQIARSLYSANHPVTEKSSFDTSTASLPTPLITQSRPPTTKALNQAKVPIPQFPRPAQKTPRSLQTNITGTGVTHNLKAATASRGVTSDPASSGNFHASFCCKQPGHHEPG